MKVGGIRPREALTRYRVLRRFPHFTLLEAEPRTGRTHQIRVHVASLGHPIVGDTLYGAPGKLRIAGREEKTLNRNFLHALAIEFRHPRTEALVSLRAPLPVELERFLSTLPS
jgi:23S rRNA pseudouridine1911/1915/1917 synthase